MANLTVTIESARPAAFRTLAVLFAIDLVVFMDHSALAAVIVPVERNFSLTDAAAGLLMTAFSLSYCLSLPIVGWLADRMSRKVLLALSVGVWSVTSLATGLSETYGQMLLARCLTGIGEAACATLGPPLLADCFPERQRSRALAGLFIAIPVGSALGFGLGGTLALWSNWRWVFWVTGLLGAAAACLTLFIEDSQRAGAAKVALKPLQVVRELVSNRSFLFTTFGMALMVFVLIGTNSWAPTFLTKMRGLALDQAGLTLGIVVAVSGIGGAAIGGWLGDELGRRTSNGLPWLIVIATLTGTPFLAVALWATHPAVILGCLGLSLASICAAIGPLDTLLISVTEPRIRGAAFACNVLTVHLLGEMPAPYLLGVFADWSGSLTSGLALTVPVLLVAGGIFCIGARYFPADRKRAKVVDSP